MDNKMRQLPFITEAAMIRFFYDVAEDNCELESDVINFLFDKFKQDDAFNGLISWTKEQALEAMIDTIHDYLRKENKQ
jgi:hypothetical protein